MSLKRCISHAPFCSPVRILTSLGPVINVIFKCLLVRLGLFHGGLFCVSRALCCNY